MVKEKSKSGQKSGCAIGKPFPNGLDNEYERSYLNLCSEFPEVFSLFRKIGVFFSVRHITLEKRKILGAVVAQ
jgi:hypothetical protein